MYIATEAFHGFWMDHDDESNDGEQKALLTSWALVGCGIAFALSIFAVFSFHISNSQSRLEGGDIMRLRTSLWILCVIVASDASGGNGTAEKAKRIGPLSSAVGGAQTTLTTGAGDGAVVVAVDGYGSFGQNTPMGDPTFDPPGVIGPAGTVYESGVYFGPLGLFLTTAVGGDFGSGLPSVPFLSATDTTAESDFEQAGFYFYLTQELTRQGATGSTLEQVYEITNNTGSAQTIVLLRHLDGDLDFDGTISDLGGAGSGGQVLFEFDSGDDPSAPVTYVGISTPAATIAGFTIQPYNLVDDIKNAGGIPVEVLNQVFNDTNGDGVSDVPFDVTLTIQEDVFLGAGQTFTYRTATNFGSEQESVRFTALGDSYSSGEGAGQYGDTDSPGENLCHESAWAWSSSKPGGNQDAAVLSEGVVRRNIACSGARVRHWTSPQFFPVDPNGNGLCDTNEPCVESQKSLGGASISSAEMIALTFGGNDVLFSKILIECGGAFFPTCDDAGFVPDDETEALQDQFDDALAALAAAATEEGSLRKLYSDLKSEANGAPTFVLGYPRVWRDNVDGCGFFPFQEGEMTWMNGLADDLADVIKCAAQDVGVHYVSVDFGNHALCDGQESTWWLHYIVDGDDGPSQESFHPNPLGQVAYANALKGALPGGGSVIPQNPTPVPCSSEGVVERQNGSGPPESGDLHLEASVATCGTIYDVFVPDQAITVLGGGFAPASQVLLRVVAQGEDYSSPLPAVGTDGNGSLSSMVVLPSDLPVEGGAYMKATGVTGSGATRTLYRNFGVSPSANDDTDLDGVPDLCDNCSDVDNPGQGDADRDGVGDLCDSCPNDPWNDIDGDGLCADSDPCPLDPLNDADGDGLCAEVDECEGQSDPGCMFFDDFESGDTSAWSSVVL